MILKATAVTEAMWIYQRVCGYIRQHNADAGLRGVCTSAGVLRVTFCKLSRFRSEMTECDVLC